MEQRNEARPGDAGGTEALTEPSEEAAFSAGGRFSGLVVFLPTNSPTGRQIRKQPANDHTPLREPTSEQNSDHRRV